jgi:hypothetical protein
MNDLDRLLLTQSVAALKTMKKRREVSDIPELGLKKFAFDMNTIERRMTNKGKTCGTAGCILGMMLQIAKANGIRDLNQVGDSVKQELFYPNSYRPEGPDYINYNRVSPKRAAKVAKHYLETGTVDWDIK